MKLTPRSSTSSKPKADFGGRSTDSSFVPNTKYRTQTNKSAFERRTKNKPAESITDFKYSKPVKEIKNQRPSQKQKTMEVDYSILNKKANPQAITDYTPTKNFEEHGLSPYIVTQLTRKGYTQPTQIQDQAIPHILAFKDVVGIAKTGTGKTAAFLLPLIHQVYDNPTKSILILAPTRELVTQINKELKTYISGNKVSSTVIMGGESMSSQIATLKKPKNFIIATTGRSLDLISQGALNLKTIDALVLDEMDQMLDMGFIKDIQKILGFAQNVKQLLLFSATSTKEVEKISNEILKSPVRVSVSQGQATDNVNQEVVEVGQGQNKFQRLVELLDAHKPKKAIVFENTKHGATKIEKELLSRGFKTLAIHGNKTQGQRNKALDALKSGDINILIATNVAARGLDIPLVSHVINYSLPQSKEDYIHRIGRTGRAGEIGNAYTFVTYEQKNPAPQDPSLKKNKKAKAREANFRKAN
jgi:ATP-dependent RNA helicase RhlE